MRGFSFAVALASVALGCSEAKSLPPEVELASGGGPPAQVREQRPPAANELVRRKIIYNASIDLLVDNLTEATEKLDKLVNEHHGLIARSELNTNPHYPRSGTWRVRIPVDGFAGFLRQVAQLGEGVKNKVDSEDITEKYFDYQVRIDNKKVQVERLQKIIKEQTGKISDVLEAERELGRVTTELEELKGAVKLWDNQVALTTVDVTMSERRQYVPPESPTFASSVSGTFHGSVANLVAFLQTVTLLAVALLPWTPIIALVAVGVWLMFRRLSQQLTPGSQAGKSAS